MSLSPIIRPIHGSGRVSFGPNPDSTRHHQVEGRGTRPLESIDRVSFGWGWASVGLVTCRDLQKRR